MAKSFPRSRPLNETFKEEIAGILERDISDPRLELVTVTGVHVTKDTRHAEVYVTATGGPDRYEEVLTGLDAARGRIRSLLAERVRTKFAPELHFKIDSSIDTGEQIDKALKSEAKAERKLARRREEAGVADAHEAIDSDEEA